MNAKQIKGLPVIGVAEGVSLGTIDEIYVDLEARRLLGFFVNGTTSAAASGSAYLDPAEIRSIGVNAVMIDDERAMQGEAVRAHLDALVTLDSLVKRNVLTEGGVQLGAVASIEVEPSDMTLTRIEVSPGRFQTNTMIPMAQVVSIGAEVIIVVNEVGTRESSDERPAQAPEPRQV